MSSPASLRIGIVGANSVGLSAAVLLAQDHQVVLQDDDPQVVRMLNAGICPIDDRSMAHRLQYHADRLRATLYRTDALRDADLIIVTLPTEFDAAKRRVRTDRLDEAITLALRQNPKAIVAIESTVPVGYSDYFTRRIKTERLLTAPALLRQGCIMADRLHPLRLVIGDTGPAGQWYGQLLVKASQRPGAPVVLTPRREAEAIHLFSQKQLLTGRRTTYLELLTYSLRHDLDLEQLRRGLIFTVMPSDGHASPDTSAPSDLSANPDHSASTSTLCMDQQFRRRWPSITSQGYFSATM